MTSPALRDEIIALLTEMADRQYWVSAIAPMGDAIDGWCGLQDVRARASAVLTRLRSEPAETSGWQPMETAPTDGTPIVVWWEGDYHVARWGSLWHPDNMRWLVRSAERLLPGQPRTVSELGPITNEFEIAAGHKGPSHWVPLPAAPPESPQ